MKSIKKLSLNILLFINLAASGFGVLYSVVNLWSAGVVLKSKLDIVNDEKLAEAYGGIIQSRNLLFFIGIIGVILSLLAFFLVNYKRKKKETKEEKVEVSEGSKG